MTPVICMPMHSQLVRLLDGPTQSLDPRGLTTHEHLTPCSSTLLRGPLAGSDRQLLGNEPAGKNGAGPKWPAKNMPVHPSWHMTGLLESALAAVLGKKELEDSKDGAEALWHLLQQHYLAEKIAVHVGIADAGQWMLFVGIVQGEFPHGKGQTLFSLLLCSFCYWRCTFSCFAMVRACAIALGKSPSLQERAQGQESKRKLARSLLLARMSFDSMCFRARETSSKVGRSLGSFDMHCLPSLHTLRCVSSDTF